MGVKYLWSAVEPACKEKPVCELFGKRLAIDTSCWVVSDNQILPSHIAKPHLRNLFFRTASLLDNGIDPVYVLEGQAPELKAQVMRKRQEARFGQRQQGKGTASTSATQSVSNSNNSTGRSRYKYIQKECAELLDAIGVVTVTSLGEAEAACAALNHQGIVDGCITIDGDAFLYGARTVYRNLSTDINNFVCQEYSMDLIESRLNLSRDKLIAMGVLFGCDYLPDGVPGVKRDQVLQLLSSWKNGQALEIINNWLVEEIPAITIPVRPAHCSQCKHPGSLRSHAKSGCLFCNTHGGGCNNSSESCKCEWHSNELYYEELAIRAKLFSLKDELHIEKIFSEFSNEIHLKRKNGSIPPWKMPSITTFVEIAVKKLKWEPQYAAEKILPLLSRWTIIHGNTLQGKMDLPIIPTCVLKKRVKRGCPMYEVEWKFSKETKHFPLVFQTCEPQFLLEREFPNLVPKPIPKPIKVTRKKKNTKTVVQPKQQEVDIVTLFTKIALDAKPSTSSSVTPDCSVLDLTGGTDDSDLSAIIDDICKKKKQVDYKNHIYRVSVKSSKIDVNSKSRNSFLRMEKHTNDGASGLPDYQAQKFENHVIEAKKPLPNFSLNFSLDKFLEDSVQPCSDSPPKIPSNENESKEVCSTPIRTRLLDAEYIEEKDSFSTPSPLTDRFSRWHL